MEWCLDCHRAPREVRPPEGRGLSASRGSRRPTSSSWDGSSRRNTRSRPRSPAPRATDEPGTNESRRPWNSRRVRRRPGGEGPRRYWKSLDELADAPAFLEFLHREFPEQASMFEDPKGRREFMTLMGASLALAGLTACTRQPAEKIVPYVRQPGAARAGPAPLLRDGRRPRRVRARHPRREPRGAADQGRGQPGPPGEPRRTRTSSPRPHVLGLYDPDRVADRPPSRPGSDLGRVRRRAARARSRRRRPRRGRACVSSLAA